MVCYKKANKEIFISEKASIGLCPNCLKCLRYSIDIGWIKDGYIYEQLKKIPFKGTSQIIKENKREELRMSEQSDPRYLRLAKILTGIIYDLEKRRRVRVVRLRPAKPHNGSSNLSGDSVNPKHCQRKR